MEESINRRIGARVRELRARLGLSLEAVAEKSGVSRSAISLIERAQTSPTAVVLDRLAAGLGVTLSALIEKPHAVGSPVSRRNQQTVWRDPASGYVRRDLSPTGADLAFQLTQVNFPAGSHVAFANVSRGKPTPRHQQVWVLAGTIEVSVGQDVYTLRQGDCLALSLDRPTGFRNRSRSPARYLVVVEA